MRPTIHYEDFALRLEPDGREGFTVGIQHAPDGGGSAPFRPPFGAESLERVMRALEDRVRSKSGRPVRALPRSDTTAVDAEEIGGSLFRALLSGRVRDSFRTSLGRTSAGPHGGLRLRLVFDPSRPGVTSLAALPWELLYDASSREFLSRNPLTPVVRFLDVPRFTLPPPVAPPLRILVVMSSVRGYPPLKLDDERRSIEDAWGRHPSVTVDFLPLEETGSATTCQVRERLREEDFHILHFMGHGDFDRKSGEGQLLFCQPGGDPEPVSGRMLAELLRGIPSLRMVFLNACHSGELPRREGLDPFSGAASALVMGGVPAVLAMQLPITDRAALTFADRFYRSLAARDPVEAAVAEGRLAVYLADPSSLEWATPALYLRTSNGRILEEFLGGEAAVAPPIREAIRDVSELIDDKTRGFVGRRFVFDAVERFLHEAPRGYFQITGAPGIGKTALLAELVRRHRFFHHFNSRPEGVFRPEAFLGNLCAQLIAHHGLGYSALPAEALRDGAFLSSLLAEVSRKLAPGERTVFLVDALDEADGSGLEPGVNPLYLPPSLPPGVYSVLTSRPLEASDRPRIDCEQDEIEIVHDSAVNLADIRALVGDHLGRRGIRDYLASQELTEEEFVDEMAERSEGNFMYLSYMLPALETGVYRDRTLRQLPQGLKSYYEDHWKRMRGASTDVWLAYKLPVLAALAVFEEAVPFELILDYSRVGDPRYVREVLHEWRPFLHTAEHLDEAGRSERLYRIYHASFHDFLTGKNEIGDQRSVISREERRVIRKADRVAVEAMLDELEQSGAE